MSTAYAKGSKAVPRGRILFADNNADFRTTRARLLHPHYQVLEASSVQEAEQCLHERWVHLAILDIRLEDDSDKKDISGLQLAQAPAYRALPKIILTSYATVEAARVALGPVLGGLPPAVNFLQKDEGAEAMIAAIEESLAHHVRINWNLVLQTQPQQPLTCAYLVSCMQRHLAGEHLLERADELEDLLRRLFYEYSQLTLERLLWQDAGQVAFLAVAFQEGALPASFVVVCGEPSSMTAAAQRYHTFAPRVMGTTGTVLSLQAATLHFVAHAYTLANTDLEQIQPLTDVYRMGPDKACHDALEGLLQQTFAAWHHDSRIPDAERALDTIYRERLHWPADVRQQGAARLQALLRQVLTLGLEITHADDRLTVEVAGETFTYPEPIAVLSQPSAIGQPVLLTHTPGRLTGENILADAQGRTWLTDFAEAGLAPWLWNVVALEAIIRFDWVEHSDLARLHDMERRLSEASFHTLELRQIKASLRKPVRALQTLRRLAVPLVGADTQPYTLGLAFQAATRFLRFDPTVQLTRREIVRLAHALLAAAMLCGKLESGPVQALTPSLDATGLQLDHASRTVWVNVVRVFLTGQSYDLLHYLYTHAQQVCTRRELVEQVLGLRYDEMDSSQVSRLNTAVRRLRERIEADPSQPRFLRTEAGEGYLLLP
jgi:DNA-binding response OmpR family regulator